MTDRATGPNQKPLPREADARSRRRPMPRQPRPRLRSTPIGASLVGLLAAAHFLGALPARASDRPAPPIPIAILDFDYTDTSGEVADQSEKHRMLLESFAASLRRDLARGGTYRIVVLACAQQPCSAGRSTPADLLARARDAGATLLLYGGIHKTSTLVQWAKVQIVDVRRDALVFDRLLTFRGDDARAWQRAQEFLAADLEQRDLSEVDRARNAASPHGTQHP